MDWPEELIAARHRVAIWDRLWRTALTVSLQSEGERDVRADSLPEKYSRVSNEALLEVMRLVHEQRERALADARRWVLVRDPAPPLVEAPNTSRARR